MNSTLQQTLYDRYPAIFRQKDLPMTQTCMCWGIETENGWYAIISALCEAIDKPYSGSASTIEDGSTEGFDYEFPQVVADQIKSKYGTLRFYYHLEYDAAFEEQAKIFPKTTEELRRHFQSYVDGAVGMAEAMSARTCEETGQPGELMVRGGWWKTVCAEVAAREGYVKPEARE